MAEGLPEEENAIGENDRDRNTLVSGNSLRVHGRLPGNIRMPTNQIRTLSARAHVSRELCARAPQDLSVYIKRVEWRTESFGLGLAKV